tara:strand:- start:17914 stop:18519 length:606 start_codon:yes stop_codon:yes gene_type:complete
MSSEGATQKINQERAAKTQELMENIMTGGEISKKREAELQKAADYGRGIQFVEGSPKVEGLTQKDGKPVFRTGASAVDYTGRITASAPTFGELAGDLSRAVFGGQAKDPAYLREPLSSAPGTTTKNYMQYTPKPQKVKGIVPTMVEKGGTPIGMAMNAILGKEDISKESAAEKRKRIYEAGVKDYSTLLGGQRNQKGGLIK